MIISWTGSAAFGMTLVLIAQDLSCFFARARSCSTNLGFGEPIPPRVHRGTVQAPRNEQALDETDLKNPKTTGKEKPHECFTSCHSLRMTTFLVLRKTVIRYE